jgi:hypothetical protein
MRNSRRRLNMQRKRYAVVGVVLLGVLTVGLLAAYAAPIAVANSSRRRWPGCAWWSEGLTEQQVNEIRQKIWDIRARASAEGWSEEQMRTAIHQLLAQYGIDPEGPGFVDSDGDGICDHLGVNRGHGYRHWQCLNQKACPRT